MKTARTTQVAAFVAAMAMSIALNGGMLMTFDAVSQQAGATHQSKDIPNANVLATVTVVGHRS